MFSYDDISDDLGRACQTYTEHSGGWKNRGSAWRSARATGKHRTMTFRTFGRMGSWRCRTSLIWRRISREAARRMERHTAMPERDPTCIGRVRHVMGATVTVALDPDLAGVAPIYRGRSVARGPDRLARAHPARSCRSCRDRESCGDCGAVWVVGTGRFRTTR